MMPSSGSTTSLMNFEEMKSRYDEGCDSLDLTLEKWERILSYSKTGFCLNHFQDILKAAVVPIFLCAEYANQCRICPIYRLCKQGNSDEWINLMRVVQAYAIAGDMLPRDTLVAHIHTFVEKLKGCRDDTVTRMH